MRKFFNGLVLGILVGGAIGWSLTRQWHSTQSSPEEQQFKIEATRAVDAAGESLYHMTEAAYYKLKAWNLNPDEVKEDLALTGKVVRRKARELTGKARDAASDARITATIKARLAGDPDLSVWDIAVSTEEGRVTLDGTVADEELVGRAVLLAMDEEGVEVVTANLKVKPKE